ncbi:hypothetical protein Tmar_1537 [Thermaerobacter marianensis DSM 12885]|uniref:Uncharacterized protein n=1 Tax=Thermaerobacter marianensis (strain ATCC 700841 / DSM 12885 / JCM 10246 / 7p75a) TaxID=644966 RepID=E6SGR3_THEM7|nr:hypothetical protein Tmar_1537 [Thermaerobacter marianensis DSM 12885]
MRRWIGVAAALVVVGSALFIILSNSRASSPWWADLPPGEKRDLFARQEAERYSVPPAPKDQEQPGPLGSQQDPQRPVGIIPEGEYPDSSVVIQNRWQGPFGNGVVQIFAGATADDPSQGLVIVHWLDKDWGFVRGQRFLAPAKVGSLEIVAANNGAFTLRSSSGRTLTFDLRKLSFEE